MLTDVDALLTLLIAQAMGWLDFRGAELREPAVLLLVAAGLMSAIDPARAWRWGITFGLSVPIALLVSRVTGAELPFAVESYRLAFLAMVPALLGAAIGSRMRRPGAEPRESQLTPRT